MSKHSTKRGTSTASPVDLGVLQADFISASKAHRAATKALARAEQAADAAKAKLAAAREKLAQASRVVLTGGE